MFKFTKKKFLTAYEEHELNQADDGQDGIHIEIAQEKISPQSQYFWSYANNSYNTRNNLHGPT